MNRYWRSWVLVGLAVAWVGVAQAEGDVHANHVQPVRTLTVFWDINPEGLEVYSRTFSTLVLPLGLVPNAVRLGMAESESARLTNKLMDCWGDWQYLPLFKEQLRATLAPRFQIVQESDDTPQEIREDQPLSSPTLSDLRDEYQTDGVAVVNLHRWGLRDSKGTHIYSPEVSVTVRIYALQTGELVLNKSYNDYQAYPKSSGRTFEFYTANSADEFKKGMLETTKLVAGDFQYTFAHLPTGRREFSKGRQ